MSATETTAMESGNSKANSNLPQKPKSPLNLYFTDALVILFCVTGAAFSLNMFRLDLFQSMALQNKKPMGSVTVKYNNVQRRFSDRVLWSRLAVESPVYLGDLIRVAEYSAATLHINDDMIDLNENTLIRIRASVDNEGRVVIDLGSGSLSISGGKTGAVNRGVALSVMGKVVAPQTGTILSASADEDGMKLQVNEGSVTITEEGAQGGQSRQLVTGENLVLDIKGVEQSPPSAVVTQPRPNARFIKNAAQQPLDVNFAWNAVNIDQKQPLRLEIAAGSAFTRITRTIEGVDSANTALGAGTWYWRLMYQNTVLSSGQFTIVDVEASALASPIKNSLFRSQKDPPAVRFEWQPLEYASYYILEAALTPDFQNPLITKQTAAASFVEQVPQAGTWYWRVKPVFPSLFEGSADFSQTSSFRIELIDEPEIIAVATGSANNTERQGSSPSSASSAPSAAESALVEKRISSSVTLVLPEAEPEAEVVREPETKPEATPVFLPEAKNLLPANGHRIQFEDLRVTRRIDFSWSPVAGANAYIFTLYHQIGGGQRRRVIQTDPLQRTRWALSNLSILDRGTFIWEVEAININRRGRIERRGLVAENTFIIDIPVSGNLEVEDIGELYEN